ncbi:hypothetical protein lerEdw1_008945 [Lerista edwardsae]|nr:hypothetical protein lerEdw1_008945 [Lerista edwardsae]
MRGPSRAITSQPPKEHKLPTLTPDHRQLEIVSGKSFGSRLFEDSWKHAVIKTSRIKQEFTSAYGLRDSNEIVAMPSITRGSEKCPVVPNPSPVAQMTDDAANPFPASSYSKHDPCSLPPLHLVPSTSTHNFLDGFFRSKGDTAMEDINKKGMCSWKPGPLKTTGIHGGAGELGAVRLKKYNRCSSLISFPEGSRFKSGYRFTDPVSGAPPQYLQRLSELAALECETIHQERNRKRRTKKQET